MSIVLCVFNSQKYLVKCLDSLVNQTLKDIEIICVNDGSTDKSKKYLEEYLKNDSRIKIINQKNQGVGHSRNNGLKIAKGEYVTFFDGDDWAELTLCEKLYKNAKIHNSDISMCGISLYNEKNKTFNDKNFYYTLSIIPKKYLTQSFSPIEGKEFLFKLNFEIWNKIYNKKFLLENSIKSETLEIFNDVIFYFKTLSSAKIISYVNENLIYYRKHSNARSKYINKYKKIFITSFNISLDHIDKLPHSNKIKKYAINRMIEVISILFLVNGISSEDEHRKIKLFLQKNRFNIFTIFKFELYSYFEHFILKYCSYSIYKVFKKRTMNAKINR